MNSKVRHIIYGIISFVLSFVLFLLSFAIVLQSTILNPSYIMDNMNTSNYFVDKRDEIKESLVDLGYASGLDEKFFENVVDEVTIHRPISTAFMQARRLRLTQQRLSRNLTASLTAT